MSTITLTDNSGNTQVIALPANVSLTIIRSGSGGNGASLAPVTITGTLADATPVQLSLQPGQRAPLVSGSIVGSAWYSDDGLTVLLENEYAGTQNPLSGTFAINCGNVTLFSGPISVDCYQAEPFWTAQPTPKADPDWSAWPKYTGGQNASMAAAVAKSNTGVGGYGIACLGFGATGERADLGGPLWDVAYLTNPTAANAAAVFAMGNVSARWPIHVLDPATNAMIDMSKNPPASFNAMGAPGNPLLKVLSRSGAKVTMAQAQAHATNYCAVAAELYGCDYYRSEVGFWANYYESLWQGKAQRQPNGCVKFTDCQTRGSARGLDYLLFACKYAPDEWQPMFKAWATSLGALCAAWATPPLGIPVLNMEKPYGNAFAPWQEQLLIDAFGRALDAGFTGFQAALDRCAEFWFDAVLGDGGEPACGHEMATLYTLPYLNTDGTEVTSYRGVCTLAAAIEPNFAAGIAQPEGSLARIHALMKNAPGYQAGDFCDYPWSATGFAMFLRLALVAFARHATDQTRAQAAWTKFLTYFRADCSADPKYCVIP